jgi:hypothetical protein
VSNVIDGCHQRRGSNILPSLLLELEEFDENNNYWLSYDGWFNYFKHRYYFGRATRRMSCQLGQSEVKKKVGFDRYII